MKRDPEATRARILAAAEALFYDEGIRAVGVDAIAARAGVTKRTLYYHFRSKDDLIGACLAARDAPTRARYRDWVEAGGGELDDQVAMLFASLARQARDPEWKGCGFARAAAELAGDPAHPGVGAAAAHKRALEDWFAARFADEGLADPAQLARQLMVLFDGAMTAMLIHRDPAYAEAAGVLAVTLLGAARR